jgi:serine/threonine protein kinase
LQIAIMLSHLGAAVNHMHSMNMIHRDIKADNVLMASAHEGCACKMCIAIAVLLVGPNLQKTKFCPSCWLPSLTISSTDLIEMSL